MPGWSTLHTKSSTSERLQSTNYSAAENLCAIAMVLQNLSMFLSVRSLFADSQVWVDNWVDHKVTREVKDLLKQQMVGGGVKLERNMPPQQIFAKSMGGGGLVFEGGAISSEYSTR